MPPLPCRKPCLVMRPPAPPAASPGKLFSPVSAAHPSLPCRSVPRQPSPATLSPAPLRFSPWPIITKCLMLLCFPMVGHPSRQANPSSILSPALAPEPAHSRHDEGLLLTSSALSGGAGFSSPQFPIPQGTLGYLWGLPRPRRSAHCSVGTQAARLAPGGSGSTRPDCRAGGIQIEPVMLCHWVLLGAAGS